MADETTPESDPFAQAFSPEGFGGGGGEVEAPSGDPFAQAFSSEGFGGGTISVPSGTIGMSDSDIQRAFTNPELPEIDDRARTLRALHESTLDPLNSPERSNYIGELLQMEIENDALLEQTPVEDTNARTALIVKKEELKRLLDVELEAAQRADSIRAGNDVAALVKRFGKDAARDYLAIKAGAWGAAKVASKLPTPTTTPAKLAMWGLQGLSFVLAGSTVSGLTEMGIEAAEDQLLGESAELPTMLDAFGVKNPEFLSKYGMSKEAAGEDPTWGEALLRGYEEFITTGTISGIAKTAKPLYQYLGSRMDDGIVQFGKAFLEDDDAFLQLTKRAGEYRNFKTSVKDLAATGYLDHMRLIVQNKIPNPKQIAALAKNTGLDERDLTEFYKKTVTGQATLSLQEYNAGLMEMFGKGLEKNAGKADEFLSHYWTNVLETTGSKAKATPEFSPNWNKIRREALGKTVAGEREKLGARFDKLLAQTKAQYEKSALGPVTWATNEKKLIYKNKLDKVWKKAPTQKQTDNEKFWRAMASELKDFTERTTKGIDELAWAEITGSGVDTATVFSKRAGGEFAGEAGEEVLGLPAMQKYMQVDGSTGKPMIGTQTKQIADHYSLPGPTTPIRTDLPAKYKYQVRTLDGDEVMTFHRPRTFEFDKAQGIFVEVTDVTDDAGMYFTFEPRASNTSFYRNMEALNTRYGALAGVDKYVNDNAYLGPFLDKTDKLAKNMSSGPVFQSGIYGQHVGTEAGAIAGGITAAATGLPISAGVGVGALGGSQMGKYSYATARAIQGTTKARLDRAARALQFGEKAAMFTGKIPRNYVEIAADTKNIAKFTALIRNSPSLGPVIASYYPFMSERDQEGVIYQLLQEDGSRASFEDPAVPGTMSLVGRRLQDPMEIQAWGGRLKEMRDADEITIEAYQKATSALNKDGTLLLDDIFSPEALGLMAEAKGRMDEKKEERSEVKVDDDTSRRDSSAADAE